MSIRVVAVVAVVVWGCSSCAATVHTLKRDDNPTRPIAGRAVLEPFGEEAALQMYSSSSGNTTTYWKDKPPLAQADSLRALSRATEKAGKKYGFVPTAELPDGDILLVRPVVLEQREIESNGFLQYLLLIGGCAFLCPPLWVGNIIIPFTRTEQIRIGLMAFRVPAAEARARLVTGGFGTQLRTDGLLPEGTTEIVIRHTAEGGIFGGNATGGDQLMTDLGGQVAEALAQWIHVDAAAAAPPSPAAPSL